MLDDTIEPAIRERVTLEAMVGVERLDLSATIANVTPHEVWVGVSKIASVHLPRLSSVRVVLLRPDAGRLAADTTVTRVIGADGRVAALRRPRAWIGDAARSHGRMALAIPAYLRRDNGEGVVAARTTNVSVGGFQCVTDLPVELGERLRTTLLLSPVSSFDCLAQVVRLEDDPHDPSQRKLSVALRFLELSETEQARIAAAVAVLDDEP